MAVFHDKADKLDLTIIHPTTAAKQAPAHVMELTSSYLIYFPQNLEKHCIFKVRNTHWKKGVFLTAVGQQ